MSRLYLLAILALAPTQLASQRLFEVAPGAPLHFHSSDTAILSGSSNRRDIDCRVEPLRPRLGFDLKYTAGYAVHVSADAVEPSGDHLRVLFRISPSGGEPVHFRQEFPISPRSATGGGTASFPARYVLGPGRYKVDWLMRNRRGNVCSAHWETRAPTPGHTGRLAAAATANLIAPYREEVFVAEPPVVRADDAASGRHISILLNLAPRDRERFKLNDYELESVIGMLRSLHREPDIGMFSLTAFSGIDRQVVYASESQTRLDFEALGSAVRAMEPGIVSAESLADPEGEGAFLAEILNGALKPPGGFPDAVVLLGPKVDREMRLPSELLDLPAEPPPLFQLSFTTNPRSYPWPGAIEAALRPYGLKAYSVTLPQEFSRALEDMLPAIVAGRASESDSPLASGVAERR